jgi:hypothetical protein
MKFQNNVFTKIQPDQSVENTNYGSIKFDSVDSISKGPGERNKAYVSFELVLDNKKTIAKRKEIVFNWS